MAREVSTGGFNYIALNWVVGIWMSLYTFTGFKLFIAWNYQCGCELHIQSHSLWSLAVLFRVMETWKSSIHFPDTLMASLDTNEENFAKNERSDTCRNKRDFSECCAWKTPCSHHSWMPHNAFLLLCPHRWHIDSWHHCRWYSYLWFLGQNCLLK